MTSSSSREPGLNSRAAGVFPVFCFFVAETLLVEFDRFPANEDAVLIGLLSPTERADWVSGCGIRVVGPARVENASKPSPSNAIKRSSWKLPPPEQPAETANASPSPPRVEG
ncbi:hypothetical protein JG688_00016299 [Phytophthora aleatoria]|uniref:Uncharacterized protein n=1 Tax=Phytophthora aleatoria TaxID=2496075 RepID=A0A8J5IG52_9STRA|nr:hypothetical protein JG688_00016299 [Phytophthora aleatoria]